MKIAYLGTGAAEGIPAIFCSCPYCSGVRLRGGKEIRSRSQILIDGELSVEFPPDAFYHAAAGARLNEIKYVLVTHSHMDHFYAHDFILHGYKYAYGAGRLDIYGNAEVLKVFEECTRRELRADVGQTVALREVKAFEPVFFGKWRVTPLPARHSSESPLTYCLEKDGKRILHLTDTGYPPEENFEFLQKAGGKPFDLITFDCTFLFGTGSDRHMTIEENEKIRTRLTRLGLADGNTRCVITHFSHNAEPTAEKLRRAEREYGVIAAYDGMTLEL